MAALVITPQTWAFRVACWSVVALLAWRAAFGLDMTPINSEQVQIDLTASSFFHHHGSQTPIKDCSILGPDAHHRHSYALLGAFVKEPLVRQLRPVNSTPSTLMDALDLVFNSRDFGWNWQHGTYVARNTRPSDRMGFVSHVILSAIVHAFHFGTLSRTLQSLTSSPVGLCPLVGGSIFDETLPFHVRYLQLSITCVTGGIAAYSSLQINYDVHTLVGVLFLGQDPTQWPPSLDAPWRATSLADFWGRRWNQWLRHIFLVQGGYPFGFFFGRAGLVIGAFLSSAVFHYIVLRLLDGTARLWWMLAGFGMTDPGILAERAFERWTGRRVGGFAGWACTMAWLVLWGHWIMDAFMRADRELEAIENSIGHN